VMNDAVYVFTRDRPDLLYTSLDAIADLDARKYVVDDSCEKVNQLSNAQLTSERAGILYVGNAEYTDFRASLNTEGPAFDMLLRSLAVR
jgi:hypothetical protein